MNSRSTDQTLLLKGDSNTRIDTYCYAKPETTEDIDISGNVYLAFTHEHGYSQAKLTPDQANALADHLRQCAADAVYQAEKAAAPLLEMGCPIPTEPAAVTREIPGWPGSSYRALAEDMKEVTYAPAVQAEAAA
jgi:hypothetical protein